MQLTDLVGNHRSGEHDPQRECAGTQHGGRDPNGAWHPPSRTTGVEEQRNDNRHERRVNEFAPFTGAGGVAQGHQSQSPHGDVDTQIVHEEDARGVGVVGEQHEDQREGDIPVVLQTGDERKGSLLRISFQADLSAEEPAETDAENDAPESHQWRNQQVLRTLQRLIAEYFVKDQAGGQDIDHQAQQCRVGFLGQPTDPTESDSDQCQTKNRQDCRQHITQGHHDWVDVRR